MPWLMECVFSKMGHFAGIVFKNREFRNSLIYCLHGNSKMPENDRRIFRMGKR
jgi:hypothetical protein